MYGSECWVIFLQMKRRLDETEMFQETVNTIDGVSKHPTRKPLVAGWRAAGVNASGPLLAATGGPPVGL